jgi:hypothetical protein
MVFIYVKESEKEFCLNPNDGFNRISRIILDLEISTKKYEEELKPLILSINGVYNADKVHICNPFMNFRQFGIKHLSLSEVEDFLDGKNDDLEVKIQNSESLKLEKELMNTPKPEYLNWYRQFENTINFTKQSGILNFQKNKLGKVKKKVVLDQICNDSLTRIEYEIKPGFIQYLFN